MSDKHELTEKLKVLETKINDIKIDLHGIKSKLNIAYEYEESLLKRHVTAKKKTEELRLSFFTKSNEILEIHKQMKNIMDVFTGNFYTNA